MSARLSLYEEFQDDADERAFVAEMSDHEADAELDRLEAAYARFIAGTYRTWSPERRYASDRRALLYQCLHQREIIAEAERGFDGLSDDGLAKYAAILRSTLRRCQFEIVKLRSAYYAGAETGSA